MSLEVGERFVIVSRGERARTGDRIPLVLGRGRAFGSGDHETTRSCLEELERLEGLRGRSALDLGCGTGILALAAARLGAGTVVAVDPELGAVANTLDNARLNGLQGCIHPVRGTVECVARGRFDLVLANLWGDILLSKLDLLATLTRPGGGLLLSGIQLEYVFDIKQGLGLRSFELASSRILDEYATLVFSKPVARPGEAEDAR